MDLIKKKNKKNQKTIKRIKNKFHQMKATRKHYKQALLANAEAVQSAFYGFSYNYLLRITINCNSGTLFYHEMS